MMNKIFIIILTLLLSTSLMAAGSDSSSGSSSSSSSSSEESLYEDAVKLVKIGSEIVGGKGGGGRSDFAQAGGIDSSKIDNAIEKIKSLI